MRQPRAQAAVVVCEERIFVFGGFDGRFVRLSSCETYEPKADRQVAFSEQRNIHLEIYFRWTQLSDMPTPRRHAAAVHLPGIGVLVVGGLGDSDEDSRTAELLVPYDVGGGTWRAIVPMITARRFPSAIYSSHSVLVADGWSESTLEELSISTGQPEQWSVVTAHPSPRRWISSMCVFNGRIVLAGELTKLN